jgi:putative ATP-dependent endonuclease of OLD family
MYQSLESLGICTIDGGGEGSVSDLAKLYRSLGKRAFALCDKQTDDKKQLIGSQVDCLLMHDENGFEDLVLKNTTQAAMERFAQRIIWPPHILAKKPLPTLQEALWEYFGAKKADWGIADFLAQCTEDEIPTWLREACKYLKTLCDPPATPVLVPLPPPPLPPNAGTAAGWS